MHTLQTTNTNTPCPVSPRQRGLYLQLRRATAMAGGLEAIVSHAIDAGEITPSQLDHIADLSTHLTEHLASLAQGVAEQPG